MSEKRIILITGAAGFIGYHTCIKLLENGETVIGLDNINNYYDIELKKKRLSNIEKISNSKNLNWNFIKGNLEDKKLLDNLFAKYKPEIIINLAAQAGVRYSLEEPLRYINSNILGFVNLLECCKNFPIKNFIYASSSSVYGGNLKLPFDENDPVNHPVSLYAATKKSNELLAHSYSHIYGLPCIGLRLFTVYGAYGRPDMAPMIFTDAILNKKTIQIFNDGKMSRDFTYIDDVVEFIKRLLDKPPIFKDKSNYEFENFDSNCPYLIFNIGCGNKIKLLDFIEILEKEIGIKAIKSFTQMQKGDVVNTFASNQKIVSYTQYKPQFKIENGIKLFVKWYKNFYGF